MIHYADCQPGWTHIGFKCYRMYKQSINFASALEACRDIGARLATLQDRVAQLKVASKSLKFLFVIMCISQKVYG